MEVQQEHIRDEDDPVVPIREASLEELDDAVSRNLPVESAHASDAVGYGAFSGIAQSGQIARFGRAHY